MNQHLKKLDDELDEILDCMIKSALGKAVYPKERREDMRTLINYHSKIFASESAMETSKLIVVRMATEDEKQARLLLADFGYLTDKQLKLIEKK